MFSPRLRIGIDASNIRAGGGLTHLAEFLGAARPNDHGITEITVWASRATLERLPQRRWLRLVREPLLDRSLPLRMLWQQTRATQLFRESCDLLFVPGGSYLGTFQPFVTMSQNLLPFETSERRRYGYSSMRARLSILRMRQARTFRRADGVIFLTERSRKIVESVTGKLHARVAVIPHGTSEVFRSKPRTQRPLSDYSLSKPFRWLYVSIIDVYKHQWQLVEAAGKLAKEGFPSAVDLIGPAYPPAMARLHAVIERVPSFAAHYVGPVPYSELPEWYHAASAFVFPSSCEAFGQTLLDAMAAGLPIASSNRSGIPDVLGSSGLYFDPKKVDEIVGAMRDLMLDVSLRTRLAGLAYERAQGFSWARCAHETLAFLSEVACASKTLIPPRAALLS